MAKFYFHDLPIYRLQEADYEKELNNWVKDGLREASGGGRTGTPAAHQRYIDGMTDHFRQQYGQWRFNEIIGYLRLYFHEQHIGSDWHFVDRRWPDAYEGT